MGSEFMLRITLMIFRVLITLYSTQDQPDESFLLFLEGEKIVLTGDFKGTEKLVLCDNEFLDKCSYLNEQRIILKGQTQLLIEISIYPWSFGDQVWYHTVPTEEKGYRFIIGQAYDKVTPINEGGY